MESPLIPTIYILDAGTRADTDDGVPIRIVKIGTTWHPERRKLDYITACGPNPPRYRALFTIDAGFNRSADLYLLDRRFLDYLGMIKKAYLNIQRGSGLEWYWDIEDHISLIGQFLDHIGLAFDLEREDPYPNDRKFSKAEKAIYKQEKKALKDLNKFKTRFENIVLPGRRFRRIQNELWDLFRDRIRQGGNVHGLVQWPTGVGKTLAIMIMVILAKKYRFKSEPLQGVIICPQTNIFESTLTAFRLLEYFGIQVVVRYGGRSSRADLPPGDYILLMTHQGVVQHPRILQGKNFILYDEVHRITGDKMFQAIQAVAPVTPFILGTSATPLTSSSAQHKKILELFGDRPLHICDYITAILEGYICIPRFNIHVFSVEGMYDYIFEHTLDMIDKRRARNMWQGGKMIYYVPSLVDEMNKAYQHFREKAPDIKVYNANHEGEGLEFQEAEANGTTRVLFTCQKYREGSDIKGLEMTNVIIGESITPYILIQIAGRTLRSEYPEKEGWCNIFKPVSDSKASVDKTMLEIFDQLLVGCGLFNLEDLGDAGRAGSTVRNYIGEIGTDHRKFDHEESIDFIQNLYHRTRPENCNSKELFDDLKRNNLKMGLKTEAEFREAVSSGKYEELSGLIVDYEPNLRFKGLWENWAKFLGVDIDGYPKTFEEWRHICMGKNVHDRFSYQAMRKEFPNLNMPEKPGEVYGKQFNNFNDDLRPDSRRD